MVDKKLKGVVIFIVVISLISLVSANVEKGNLSYFIQKDYGPADLVVGWINISFSGESITSILETSFGSISLTELLAKTSNSLVEFSCIPLNCKSKYVATKEETSKVFDLAENESIWIGFNISRKNNLVSGISPNSFKLHIVSNNSETEKFPLAVDILNDGSYEWKAYVASDNYQEPDYGCFLKTATLSKANIVTSPYCETVSLIKSPELSIGAYAEDPQARQIEFKMTITRIGGSEAGQCTKISSPIPGEQKIECTPPGFSVSSDGDYSVCINVISINDINKYNISYEEEAPICGSSGYDFEIFARPKYYAAEMDFNLDNNGLIAAGSDITNVEKYINSSIKEMYNRNCSKDCIVPIKIFSGLPQRLTLSDAAIIYEAGIATTTNKIYNVSQSSAEVASAGFQKIDLSGSELRVPATFGNHTFYLMFNEYEVFSEKIAVREIAIIKTITPTTTAIKYPTKFTIILNETGQNISKYTWKFGDGSSEKTTVNYVTHTYTATGVYKMEVIVSDNLGRNSSKESNIIVGPASTIVPELISEIETNLEYINNQTKTFSVFEKRLVNLSLKLDEIKKNVTRIKDSLTSSSTETQYENALGQLLTIDVPLSVSKTFYSENIAFYPQGGNIDLDVVKAIAGGDYEKSKEDAYKEAVLAWEEANTNTKMTYSEISSIYEDYEKPFVRTFQISVTNNGGQAYLIIKNIGNLFFSEDYSEKQKEGYTYISLDSGENVIVFSTTENVDFISVPAFVSPPISELTLTEWTPISSEGKAKRWVLFAIIAVLILLGALAIWIILQFWYKRKYENYLFKNRNNLYNIISYIENEKQKGTKEGDAVSKLRKAGWNSEQVRYAMRKYSGKRTGMPEIPIGKLWKAKKKTMNLEKK
jgi:PKD repeat protein